MFSPSLFPADPVLSRSARHLSRFATTLAWLIAPLVVAQYLFFNTGSFPLPYGTASLLAGLEWSLSQRLLAAAVGVLPALVFVLGSVMQVAQRVQSENAEIV